MDYDTNRVQEVGIGSSCSDIEDTCSIPTHMSRVKGFVRRKEEACHL